MQRLFVVRCALIFTGKSMEGEDHDENYIYSSRNDKAEGDVIKGEGGI